MATEILTRDQFAAWGRQGHAIGMAHRRREARPCSECGKIMPEAIRVREYCTNACKQRAKYKRRKVKSPRDDSMDADDQPDRGAMHRGDSPGPGRVARRSRPIPRARPGPV